MAITHFVTQFTHISRPPRIWSRKCFLGKTVYKMLSQICRKVAYLSTKLLWEKVQKTQKNHKKIHESVNNLRPILGTKLVLPVDLKTVFPQQFFFSSTLSFRMSKNTKCVRSKIYPMEVQISSISNLIFQIKFLLFVLGFQKLIASIHL